MVTSAQLRAARALLDWTVRELAEQAGVHRNTITRAETDETAHGHAVAQVVLTLEAAGVEFTNGDQPGVKLRANYDPKTQLVGPDPFQGGDGFQRVVTSELRRPLRPKETPE